MVMQYQPHVYIGKNLGGKCHINRGDTVYPWGGARDLARIGLVSAATCDGRISYIFANDMTPQTWVRREHWPTVKTAFSKRWARFWQEGQGFTRESGYVWETYNVCPITGPSSQRQRLDMVCTDFWGWSLLEDRHETRETAKQLEQLGLIEIQGDWWNVKGHTNGAPPSLA